MVSGKFLSSNIKKCRRTLGLTQEELGRRLGVTPQAISKWENMIAYPDIFLLPTVAEIFGVSIDDLLKREIVM